MSFEEQVDEIEANTFLSDKPFFSRPGGKIFIIWLAMTVVGVLIGAYAPHHLLQTPPVARGRGRMGHRCRVHRVGRSGGRIRLRGRLLQPVRLATQER